ncbi:MAG: PilZ domain-containing protein [Polyangiales bacterium]
MSQERRQSPRHVACFPVEEKAKEETRAHTAVIRELSVTGAQILAQKKREVGDEIDLSLYVKDGEPPREVLARVVRMERRDDAGLWPWLTVVTFEKPLTDLESEIVALEEKQKGMFGKK